MSDYKEFESKMKKTCEALTTQLATIRAGRANASVLDQIEVDYYGVPTPVQQVATIATPDPRSLLIQPWDASLLKPLEKAILASDLGINPQNDGRMIRLVFPPLTEERRKDLIKQTKKYVEESKVAIRNIRRDAIDKFKKQQKASEITEDDYKIAEKDIQKLTDDYIKELDGICAKKEKELTGIGRRQYGRNAEQQGGGTGKRPSTPPYCQHSGWQRPLGKEARPAEDCGSRGRLGKFSQNRNILQKYRCRISHGVRLLDRELEATERRGLHHYEAAWQIPA